MPFDSAQGDTAPDALKACTGPLLPEEYAQHLHFNNHRNRGLRAFPVVVICIYRGYFLAGAFGGNVLNTKGCISANTWLRELGLRFGGVSWLLWQ